MNNDEARGDFYDKSNFATLSELIKIVVDESTLYDQFLKNGGAAENGILIGVKSKGRINFPLAYYALVELVAYYRSVNFEIAKIEAKYTLEMIIRWREVLFLPGNKIDSELGSSLFEKLKYAGLFVGITKRGLLRNEYYTIDLAE